MSISKSEINKLKKAVQDFTGEHKFIYSQCQIIPTVSATARDKWLSGMKALTDEDTDKFAEEFAKNPYSLSKIDERQGKVVIRTIKTSSDEGQKLIKTGRVEMPGYMIFGVESIPMDENGKVIEQKDW